MQASVSLEHLSVLGHLTGISVRDSYKWSCKAQRVSCGIFIL